MRADRHGRAFYYACATEPAICQCLVYRHDAEPSAKLPRRRLDAGYSIFDIVSRTNPALVAESSDLRERERQRPGDDGDLFGKAISRAGINRYRRDIGALRCRRRRVDSHEYLGNVNRSRARRDSEALNRSKERKDRFAESLRPRDAERSLGASCSHLPFAKAKYVLRICDIAFSIDFKFQELCTRAAYIDSIPLYAYIHSLFIRSLRT